MKGVEAVKRLYIQYEFDACVHRIKCRCNGTKGYSIINDDGSRDASEYTEAFNRIMLVLNSEEDALISFGNDSMMDAGYGRQYGRLIRNWCHGKLSCVTWDKEGNIISRMEKEDDVSERGFAKLFLAVMLAAHAEAESAKS